MKKYILWVLGVLILFIGLTYWSVSETEETFSTCEILVPEDANIIDFKKHDSVLVAASTLYEANLIKKLMQGDQYRKAWATPVKLPIVFLDTLLGGMKVIEEGGGKQTHSLELEAPDGVRYSLRSINKNPEPLIPDFAKKLGLENIVVDGISAQHPYAAIVVANLADKAGILHTDPKMVFVPQQPTLGEFNEKYGNRIFLLEHETDGGTNWTPFKNATQIVDTEDLQVLKAKNEKKVVIDTAALVRARLFDILIGDWDRHTKQWGWAIVDLDSVYSTVPIPGDRDNAFFTIEGIIPTLISNKKILPGLQSFDKEVDYMPGLVMPFDVYFLKNVDETVFVGEANFLKRKLSDKVIWNAFKAWPENIRQLHADDIITKISARRENILLYAQRFHEILEKREYLTEPLKGSEDLKLEENLVRCFDCE